MAQSQASRLIGELTFQDVSSRLRETSILCMPAGSIEQHGPHLPLNTDIVLAEAFARLLLERYAKEFDLWQLPTVSIGLSREHDWAPGTLSLTIQSFTALMRDFGREIARSLPARNLVIVNGHGGNRGILEPVAHELRTDVGLNVCVLHPAALWGVDPNAPLPEIHGGRDETSAMLAVAPNLVRRERIAQLKNPPRRAAIQAAVTDPAATWPWSSGDRRIADLGVIGDARAATVEHGKAIMERAVSGAGPILERLLDHQRSMRRVKKSDRKQRK
jgi:creatinine amidohydrolase/Fe(II)-dependent formamide hydrolase-like protein